MKKTDKKTENALIAVLTESCNIALEKYEGFLWLTHFVDYQYFPNSLSIVCVFNKNEQLTTEAIDGLQTIIKDKLLAINIGGKNLQRQISFDTQENCERENNGRWNQRFK